MNFVTEILRPINHSICQHADNNAFFIDGQYYTYRQFAERISAIRCIIRDAGVEEQIWGLAIQDNLDTYASIFALWMEGKAYVPLHPSWPTDRIASIIDQIGCHNIITTEANNVLTKINGSFTVIDVSEAQYTHDFFDNWSDVSDEDLAYVLFTSGSTGNPKGVPLTRGNLASFVSAFWDMGYELTEEDRCLQCFDLTFDLSVMSYLVPLLRGACVYTVPFEAVKYLAICGLMEEHQLTFALMTPSTIQYLRPYMDELNFPAMRYSLFCGEALPLETTNMWAKCLPNAIIDNVYGPTEDTIFCTYYRYQRNRENKAHNGVLSIGKSMTSGQVAIFEGELCLSGKQLTPGYWKNPEKNAEAFFEKDGVRWYRTGDLCTMDEDGDLMFIGRKDSQVKIQGFRIELSEIEYHARQYYKDCNLLVMTYDNTEGTTSLGMFIELPQEDNTAFVEYLKSKMPSYMIPSRYIYMEKFPVNSSSKIDRSKLKSLL